MDSTRRGIEPSTTLRRGSRVSFVHLRIHVALLRRVRCATASTSSTRAKGVDILLQV